MQYLKQKHDCAVFQWRILELGVKGVLDLGLLKFRIIEARGEFLDRTELRANVDQK